MLEVDIDELKRISAFIRDINLTPLEDIVWKKDGKVIEVDKEKIEEWKYAGLSNYYFAKDELLKVREII
jgi:hypothetical protein